jgi:hypothetical protein
MSLPPTPTRKIRVCYFNVWAQGLEDAMSYAKRAPTMDLARQVSNPRDAALMRKARLDCDWYAENARCFAAMVYPGIEFLPAWVCGKDSVLEVARAPRQVEGEERWLITMGQQPQALAPVAGKVFELLARTGVRHAYYAFDEASREMPCFAEIAPHLSVLIHDEEPLQERGRAALRRDAVVRHHSWVANTVPFAQPFVEQPPSRLVFLGSQLGLTPHRQRQIDFLQERYGDRFTAISDHSLSVADRGLLAQRFAVSVCPEGRKFTTPAMAATHTDRPFWSGCLGLVPVSEDSKTGGRLEELHRAGFILRYPHGDLPALADACERGLAMAVDERRRVYDHFNRHETVGTVLSAAIRAAVES